MPEISATLETEAGELLETMRQRLQWAKIAPLHSSLGDKSKTVYKKKQKQKQQNIYYPQNLTIYLKIYKDSKQGDGKKLTNQMESKNK